MPNFDNIVEILSESGDISISPAAFNSWVQSNLRGLPAKTDSREFMRMLQEILGNLTMKTATTVRFPNCASPNAIALEAALQAVFEDASVPLSTKYAITIIGSDMYSGSLPASGLPIDNPYIIGALKWREALLDLPGAAELCPEMYTHSVEYLCGVLNRRATTLAFDDPCIARSLTASEKGLAVVKPYTKLDFDSTFMMLYWYAQSLKKAISPTCDLSSDIVQKAIAAYRECIALASNPPRKKMSVYMTPKLAMGELSLIKSSKDIGDESDPATKANLTSDHEERKADHDNEVAAEGMEMWDIHERRLSKRHGDRAKTKLAKLYCRLPAEDRTANLNEAKALLQSCYDLGYNSARETLEKVNSALAEPAQAALLFRPFSVTLPTPSVTLTAGAGAGHDDGLPECAQQ